jgi:O-antigen ligase
VKLTSRKEEPGTSGFPNEPAWAYHASSLMTFFLYLAIGAGFILILFDRRAVDLLEKLQWLTLALAAIADRQGNRRQRLQRVFVFFFISIGVGLAASLTSAGAAGALGAFTRYQVEIIWYVTLYLGSPMLARSAVAEPAELRYARQSALALMLFCAIALICSFAAPDPRTSMRLFGAEIGSYTGIYVLLLRLLVAQRKGESILRNIVIASCTISLLCSLLVCACWALHYQRAFLTRLEWIRVEPSLSTQPWRLQFPFQHHNRVAYFYVLVCLGCLSYCCRSKKVRIAFMLLSVGAAIAVVFTATRGGILALLAGLLVFMVLRYTSGARIRWWILTCLIAALVLFLFLPRNHMNLFRQMLDPESYRPGPSSSIGSRIKVWGETLLLIEKRPLLGFGYGYENFENVFLRDFPIDAQQLMGISHAHNLWLEMMAETGILGLASWVIFACCRIAAIRVSIREKWKQDGSMIASNAVLAIEVAIYAFGISNYEFRRNMGLLSYGILASGLAIAVRKTWPRTVAAEKEPL